MVLIFSQTNDISTDDIQLWMHYYNIKHIRLNEYNLVNSYNFSTESSELIFKKNKVDLKKMNGFIYRRPGGTYPVLPTNKESAAAYSEYLIEYEYQAIQEYINQEIKSKKHLNSIFDYKHQKLEYLKAAKELDIKVPEWIVTGDLEVIKAFIAKKKRIITKALNMPYFKIPKTGKFTEVAYSTNEVTSNDLHEIETAGLSKNILPSFLQAYIDKKFEVRVFYSAGKFYSMAIFSQQSEKTKIDYRNYDRDKPNRAVPFQVPRELEEKLLQLFKKFKLNSCSADLIYSTDNEFYFLEINPIGQFKWVSQNCNYYIEKEIAEYFYEQKQ